jgi:hypothetical protein
MHQVASQQLSGLCVSTIVSSSCGAVTVTKADCDQGLSCEHGCCRRWPSKASEAGRWELKAWLLDAAGCGWMRVLMMD